MLRSLEAAGNDQDLEYWTSYNTWERKEQVKGFFNNKKHTSFHSSTTYRIITVITRVQALKYFQQLLFFPIKVMWIPGLGHEQDVTQ